MQFSQMTRGSESKAETIERSTSQDSLSKTNLSSGFHIRQWASNFEFILMSIACKCEPPHYDYFTPQVTKNAPNPVQVFICYVLVGIPVSYMQIILGQYSKRGLFFIRYMLPILKGVIFLAIIGVFWGWVVTVLMVEQYLLYILLACERMPYMWLECVPPHDKICYQILKPCIDPPCIREGKYLAAYVYWNVTFMGGISHGSNATISTPELSRAWALALAWIVIYLITSRSFDRGKKISKLLVYLYLMCNMLLLIELVSYNLDDALKTICTIDVQSFLNFNAWTNALARMSFDMDLGDSTYIMLGVYTATKSQTGVLSCVNGLVVFIHSFIKCLMIGGATVPLIERSGIEFHDKYLLFRPLVTNLDVGVIPTVLGLTSAAKVWTVMYFLWLSLGIIANVVVEMQLLHMSIYTSYENLIGYHSYITPLICLLGFLCGLLFESKEAYEIYKEVLLKVKDLCFNTNSFILTVCVFYIYGMTRFVDDVHFLFGQAPTIFWRVTWACSPIALMWAIPAVFDRSHYYHYHMASAVAFLFLPIVVMTSYDIFRTILSKNIWSLFRPDKNWGPADTAARELRRIFNPQHQTRYRMKSFAIPCKHNCLLRNKALIKIVQEEEGTHRALHFGRRHFLMDSNSN